MAALTKGAMEMQPPWIVAHKLEEIWPKICNHIKSLEDITCENLDLVVLTSVERKRVELAGGVYASETHAMRKWLESLGLEQYIPNFEEHQVTFAVLPHLSIKDFFDIGVCHEMHCIQLYQESSPSISSAKSFLHQQYHESAFQEAAELAASLQRGEKTPELMHAVREACDSMRQKLGRVKAYNAGLEASIACCDRALKFVEENDQKRRELGILESNLDLISSSEHSSEIFVIEKGSAPLLPVKLYSADTKTSTGTSTLEAAGLTKVEVESGLKEFKEHAKQIREEIASLTMEGQSETLRVSTAEMYEQIKCVLKDIEKKDALINLVQVDIENLETVFLTTIDDKSKIEEETREVNERIQVLERNMRSMQRLNAALLERP